MNPENEAYFKQHFPLLFRDLGCRDPRKTCLAFGIETGDGWFELLKKACEKIEAMLQEMAIGMTEEQILTTLPHAAQVKQKFATLRFYMEGYDERIEKIISEAEEESGRTCENCGAPGRIVGSHWVTTLCEGCQKK